MKKHLTTNCLIPDSIEKKNELISVVESNWLDEVSELIDDFPIRHSQYQLEHFVVCQPQWPPDIQYKQCLRELRARYNIIHDHRFEYNDLYLKIDAYRIKREALHLKCSASSSPENVRWHLFNNRILRLDNQIAKLQFRAEQIKKDVADLLREMHILQVIEKNLAPKRKFQDPEKADADFWSKQ